MATYSTGIPTAPAPKPATPAPAPEPKPTTPPPAPAKEPAAPPSDADPFEELGEVFSDPKADKPEPKAPAPKEPKEPKETKPAPEPEDKRPKGFREELERTKTELKKKEEAYAALEARIAEGESKGKDTTSLVERLSKLEEENNSIRAELRVAKAEVSDEFKNKWDKPFQQSVAFASRMVQGLTVNGTENEDGTTGPPRAGTHDDFAALYRLPTSQATKMARAMFGEDAGIVMQRIFQLQEMDDNRKVALDEEKNTWKEKQAAEDAKRAQFETHRKVATDKTREAFVKKHAELYDEDPNDPEGSELLRKTREYLNRKPTSLDEEIALTVRQRLAAESFPREVARRRKLQAENDQLKATIEEMKKSKPGPGTRTSSGAATSAEEDSYAGLEDILPTLR